LLPVEPKSEKEGVILFDGGFSVYKHGKFEDISLQDPQYFCNKSFTLSFSLKTGQWVSFHSYLPEWMMASKSAFYSFNGGLWKHNEKDNFHNFYGKQYPFTVEWPFPSPITDLSSEHVQLLLEAKENGGHSKWGFFDKVVAYNNYQSSGVMSIRSRDEDAGQNILVNRIRNVQGQVQADRDGQNWYLNFFRTNVVDYSEPVFSEDCPDFSETDREFTNTDFSQDWKGRFVLDSKYMAIRLIKETGEHQMTLHYAIHKAIDNER